MTTPEVPKFEPVMVSRTFPAVDAVLGLMAVNVGPLYEKNTDDVVESCEATDTNTC